MFPKPPRPEPPRRAIATQVARQRTTQRVSDVLIVERRAPVPGAVPPLPAGAAAGEPAAAPVPPADRPPF